MFAFVYEFGPLRLIKWAIPISLGAIVVLFGLIQLIPIGRDHSNPPVVNEIAWDSPETRATAVRSCLDCHSNEVNWPWYSNIAPMSWFIEDEVEHAREEMNFSDWVPLDGPGLVVMEIIRKREMPPCDYLWLHPSARLSDEELRVFAAGMERTFGVDIPDVEQADSGEDSFRCFKNHVVYPLTPSPLRTTARSGAAVALVGIGGIVLILAYVRYSRRRDVQG